MSSRFANLVALQPRSRGQARLTAGLSYRSDSGLTTLEWLLIVAAVAGLAALAVVLVQNVVDETAEEIAGNSARETAAKVAADRIDADAREELSKAAEPNNTNKGKTVLSSTQSQSFISEHRSKCERLEITYSDIKLDANWNEAQDATIKSLKHMGTQSDFEAELAKIDTLCTAEADDS